MSKVYIAEKTGGQCAIIQKKLLEKMFKTFILFLKCIGKCLINNLCKMVYLKKYVMCRN